MFGDFDFSLLDDPDFKEDSVREELLLPILKRLGYSASGKCGIIRSKALEHPFVMIGSQQKKIYIYPDYILTYDKTPIIVIDAKSPTEELIKSHHAEQAFSYSIHPSVRAFRYALFNGKQLVVYDVNKLAPILDVDIHDIEDRWDEIEARLSVDGILYPEKKNYAPDMGLWLMKMGAKPGHKQHFLPYAIMNIGMVQLGHYTSFANAPTSDDESLAVSVDYNAEQLEQMLSIVSDEKRAAIMDVLTKPPYTIYMPEEEQIQVVISTKLGEVVSNDREDYAPFIVTEVNVKASKEMNDLYEKHGTINEWEINQRQGGQE